MAKFLLLIAVSLCFAAEAWVKGIAQDVHDGDTFKLKEGGQVIKVRIFGIDAPETDQAYGQESGKALRALIEGKEIRLRIENKDRYGRTVGEPWLGDSLNISLWMLQNGHAWWYKSYSKKRTDFEDAEKEAKAQKLGLWEGEKPTAPWDHRKQPKKKGGKKNKK
ncbi:MAG: thermonuclease family protein [Fibromonadales bacterium]|nr:thermonuclease family protein [Fibromonadales bacterium]